MSVKKTLLIIIFFIALISLVSIVIFAKERMFIFGKFYEDYLRRETISLAQKIKKNTDVAGFSLLP